MSIRTRRSMRLVGYRAAALALTAVIVGGLTVTGCSSTPPDPPGPAVGSATPQGGVITQTPEHGRRPHMAGPGGPAGAAPPPSPAPGAGGSTPPGAGN